MNQKTLSRFVMASALLFAAGACSDGGSGGPDFDDEATTAETEDMAEDAIGLTGDVIDQLNFDGPSIALTASRALTGLRAHAGAHMGASRLPTELSMPGLSFSSDGRLQLSAAPGCTISSYGSDGDVWDWLDGNENGIADDWGFDQTCVTKDSTDLENILTRTDKLKIRIKENTSSLFGYRITQAYSTVYRYENGDGFGGQFEAEETLDIRAASATQDWSYEGGEWGEEDGEREEYVYGAASDVAFDPDGTIAYGDPLPNGELTIDGRQFYAGTDDVSLSFTLGTTDPLVYDAACWDNGETPPFTDGTIVGHLNGRSASATFTIDFTACDSYDIDTDNTSDEPVVASRGQTPGRRVALRRN